MATNAEAVEFVAKAFYDLQDGARGWEQEPEILKEPFREYARAAIALLHPVGEGKQAQQLAASNR